MSVEGMMGIDGKYLNHGELGLKGG